MLRLYVRLISVVYECYLIFFLIIDFSQNQTGNLDQAIQDAAEHFVYVPKKSTINPQDIAFFLSTRLVAAAAGDDVDDKNNHEDASKENGEKSNPSCSLVGGDDPFKRLRRYETKTAELAAEFEEGMVRF
jgi:hypothetical protein